MTPNSDKIPFGTFTFGTMFGQQCLVIQILFQTFKFHMESCRNFSELGKYVPVNIIFPFYRGGADFEG